MIFLYLFVLLAKYILLDLQNDTRSEEFFRRLTSFQVLKTRQNLTKLDKTDKALIIQFIYQFYRILFCSKKNKQQSKILKSYNYIGNLYHYNYTCKY